MTLSLQVWFGHLTAGCFWSRLCRDGLAHGLAVEFDAVGSMDDAIEDGVGDGGVADIRHMASTERMR